MTRRSSCAAALGMALASGIFVALPLAAQQSRGTTLDRRVVPVPAGDPVLHVPAWIRTTLANGAQLVVVERHGLPLVSVQVNFVGGANQYETAEKAGLAGFVANQLTEGTAHRTGDQISNDLQLLGTNFNTPSITGESGRLAFTSTKDKLAASLDIVADLLVNATFPEDALERYRARTLVNLTQARDRAPSIAATVFPKVLYGAEHPYGRSLTAATAKAITRDDLVTFYHSYCQPAHAVITVVGDVTAPEAKHAIDAAFAGWKAGGSMPTFSYPPALAPRPTTIYLVDKPGAAQSSFAIGLVGPPRNTADYYALRVMNEMLGVLFQSRLNHNIREVKGYSYGVGSGFSFGRGPGPFTAGGGIVTAKTDSALIEFMKELRDIRGGRPPSDDEMAQARASLVQSLPGTFETVSGVNQNVAAIYTQGLPEDYYQQFPKAIGAVTREDVMRVAQKYIDPEHLAIVIVGDRSVIEAPLTAARIAPIVRLDVNGDPVADRVRP
jgi:zinc protease